MPLINFAVGEFGTVGVYKVPVENEFGGRDYGM